MDRELFELTMGKCVNGFAPIQQNDTMNKLLWGGPVLVRDEEVPLPDYYTLQELVNLVAAHIDKKLGPEDLNVERIYYVAGCNCNCVLPANAQKDLTIRINCMFNALKERSTHV